MANRTEFLFWTKVMGPNGRPVTVRVYVDIDYCLSIARQAAINKGRVSTMGPIRAESLKSDIHLTGQRQ